jgi:hypothetical protein
MSEKVEAPISVPVLEEPKGAMKPEIKRRKEHTFIYIWIETKQQLDEIKPLVAQKMEIYPPERLPYTEVISFLVNYFKNREKAGGI